MQKRRRRQQDAGRRGPEYAAALCERAQYTGLRSSDVPAASQSLSTFSPSPTASISCPRQGGAGRCHAGGAASSRQRRCHQRTRQKWGRWQCDTADAARRPRSPDADAEPHSARRLILCPQATPFMGAAYGGSLPTVMHLLARGADIHATDNMGCSALHFAANKGGRRGSDGTCNTRRGAG